MMQGRSYSLGGYSAFHRALIALVCVGMVVLSGSSPTLLAGADWLTPRIDDRVEQTGAPTHAAAPMVGLEICSAEDLLEDSAEPAEPTDDDETKHYLLRLDVAGACPSQKGLVESSADQAPTPFRLHAFPSRGSPSV